MKLKSVYSSSRFIEMSNNMNIASQQSKERPKCYISHSYTDQSPFCPNRGEKGDDIINRKKKTKC